MTIIEATPQAALPAPSGRDSGRTLELSMPRAPSAPPRRMLPAVRVVAPTPGPSDDPLRWAARAGHATALAHPIVERAGRQLPVYRHPSGPGAASALVRSPLEVTSATRPSSPSTRHPGPARHPGALDPRRFSCLVATAALEVVSGVRPAAQLAGWVSPTVLDGLTQRRLLGDEDLPPSSALDRTGRGVPAGPRTSRPMVRRVRTMRVDDRVVESAVVLRWADRCRAVAVRLVAGAGGWRAEALVVG